MKEEWKRPWDTPAEIMAVVTEMMRQADGKPQSRQEKEEEEA